MPPAQLSKDEVIARVMAVVRRQGYDGASIAELSKATGLGRSSLYHYFPDGKDDMVGAVLEHLAVVLEAEVFGPLRGPGSPATRIRQMSEALDAFYGGGKEACLLATLGVGDASRPFHARVRQIFREWIEALADTLTDAGLSRSTARVRAEDALIRLEGALVLARSLGSREPFSRTLKALPADLLRR